MFFNPENELKKKEESLLKWWQVAAVAVLPAGFLLMSFICNSVLDARAGNKQIRNQIASVQEDKLGHQPDAQIRIHDSARLENIFQK